MIIVSEAEIDVQYTAEKLAIQFSKKQMISQVCFLNNWLHLKFSHSIRFLFFYHQQNTPKETVEIDPTSSSPQILYLATSFHVHISVFPYISPLIH